MLQQMLIHRNLLKHDLTCLKSDFDFDINKLKKRPSGLGSLNSNVDQIDVDKLVAVPVDLSKLNDVVKMMSIKMLNKLN